MRNKRQSLETFRLYGFNPLIIIDVGVATGTEGLYEVWPESRFILVEGLPKFSGDLSRLSEELTQCECVKAFAGSLQGEVAIAENPAHAHAYTPSDAAPDDWLRVVVPIVTVDSIVTQRVELMPSTQILLKIDVDGVELAVLQGAVRTLGANCVVVIEAALLDEEVARFGRIVEFMAANGYETVDIIEPIYRPGDGLLWQVDLVFARRGSVMRSARSYEQPLSPVDR